MRNKYNAVRSRSSDGRSFHSKGERDCYEMLKHMEKEGAIWDLECQVTTKLTAGITHKTDFKCWDIKRNEPLWIEYKGFEDQRWRLIKKLWKFYGPGRLEIWAGYEWKMRLIETIIPGPRQDIPNFQKQDGKV